MNDNGYKFGNIRIPMVSGWLEKETAEWQPDGKGELRLDNGTILLPNDLYLLSKETFRMCHTSHCTGQQVIDVYIEDNHGQVVQKTFS